MALGEWPTNYGAVIIRSVIIICFYSRYNQQNISSYEQEHWKGDSSFFVVVYTAVNFGSNWTV